MYEASFANLGLNGVVLDSKLVKEHRKLLSSGVWCIVTLAYLATEERDRSPWIVDSLKPVQISNIDLAEYKEGRQQFTKEEWVDVLLQSLGLNPAEFSFRSKLLQVARLIPFAENNYNLIELGPKGTGKSHIFSEMSPHGILISGGEVTKAKLFVNNSSGDIGLVGYWDVVAYDEFAGREKRADRGLVDIMKNYMANRSFSRGTQVYGAAASMVFVGNTERAVPYMLAHSNLCEALPAAYYDSAFLDRIHAYLPGWETQKLRNEMFSNDYGFIVDYLAGILKELRKEDYTNAYTADFKLSDTITTRDKEGISKTFSGLVKLIYPHGQFSEAEGRELLDFAIENRKRVKQQLIKIDETFEEVDFSYTQRSTGEVVAVETLEVVEFGGGRRAAAAPLGSATAAPASPTPAAPDAVAGQRILRDNQTNVTYADLFAPYLVGTTRVVVTDPYIRMPYQLRNLMELARLLATVKPVGEELALHLVTFNNEQYLENSRGAFQEIADSLASSGILFTFSFDEIIHDRTIEPHNG